MQRPPKNCKIGVCEGGGDVERSECARSSILQTMEAVVTWPLLSARRCRRLMVAAGSCASRIGMRGSGKLPSYSGGFRSSESSSGWGSPMIGRAHAAVSIARRLQRALAPCEFLGPRLCRSVSSFSVFNDKIHPPGLAACGWVSNQSGGRTAGAPASVNQSRKMSGGIVFFFCYRVAGMPMLHILAFSCWSVLGLGIAYLGCQTILQILAMRFTSVKHVFCV